MKTLIVEDVDAMRDLLAQMIAAFPGYEVRGLARNGAEARFEMSRRRPDLVLLDEILPGESSLDLLEELRSEGIPVVLLTSLPERVIPPLNLPEGALGRILKPGWKSLDEDAKRIRAELDRLTRTNGGS